MIEMPEAVTISRQMNGEITGKIISAFSRGPLTHKFLWLNRPDEEFEGILKNIEVNGASSYGRSIYLYCEDHLLWWGDTGGRLLYHNPGNPLPKKYHLKWAFSDRSSLTFSMQMWGFVRLLEPSEFIIPPKDETGIPPLDPNFTTEKLSQMMDTYPDKKSKGIKGFLVATGHVSENHISGLGNAIIQDILFHANLDPRRKIKNITPNERAILFNAIQETVSEAIRMGGRYDERDLYNQPGGYLRIMDSKTVGKPCPTCGTQIKKISYLGGACYICPHCQI